MSLEQVVKLIQDDKFVQAQHLLETYSEIDINASSQRGYSLLTEACLFKGGQNPERLVFIEYLLKHPNFKRVNEVSSGINLTAFGLSTHNYYPEEIDLFMKYRERLAIDVIYSGEKLVYEVILEAIKETEEDSDSDSESEEVSKLNVIKGKIGDIALQHAIAHSDVSLLQRLDDLDIDLYRLSDGSAVDELLMRHPESREVFAYLSTARQARLEASSKGLLAAIKQFSDFKERHEQEVAAATRETRQQQRAVFRAGMEGAEDALTRSPSSTPFLQGISETLRDLQQAREQQQHDIRLSSAKEKAALISKVTSEAAAPAGARVLPGASAASVRVAEKKPGLFARIKATFGKDKKEEESSLKPRR